MHVSKLTEEELDELAKRFDDAKNDPDDSDTIPDAVDLEDGMTVAIFVKKKD